MQYSNISSKKVLINKWARIICILIFLLPPDGFFKATSVYHSNSLGYIVYKWLNYDFSVLFLILFVLTLPIIIKHGKGFLWFSALIFSRSVIFYLLNLDNIFVYQSYELLLAFICGWVLFVVGKHWNDLYFKVDAYRLFEAFCWLHLGSQILGMALSISGFTGRYNAINLDVENTSFLYAIYILLEQERSDNKAIKSYAFLIGVLLTGARIPLLLLLIVLFIQKIKKYSKDIRAQIIHTSTLFELLMILALLVLFATGSIASFTGRLSGINRILDFVSGAQEISEIGRVKSLDAGIKILKENLWGIDYSFVILQKNTVAQGYPTFPHSQVIIWRIVLGPILFWVGAVYVFHRIHLSYKAGNVKVLPLVFILLYFVFTGNPLSNFKVVFIYIWAIYICVTTKRENYEYQTG